jgi:hypothetical protein
MGKESSDVMPTEDAIIAATVQWLERAVIGLTLCPFAKAVHVKKQIRYSVSCASTPEALQDDLRRELLLLSETSPDSIDTTLLIHPNVLTDFYAYNDFLSVVDKTLEEMNLVDDFQVASLHPHYQFAGTQPDDIENFTNRSPYPVLHLLREASVTKAVAAFPESDTIFEKNISTLRSMGYEGWLALGLEKNG